MTSSEGLHFDSLMAPAWFAQHGGEMLRADLNASRLMSTEVGETWLKGLEQACEPLLGVSLGDLNDYASVNTRYLGAYAELSRGLGQAVAVLGRKGLTGLADCLRDFPTNNLSDLDVLWLLRVIIPLVRIGFVAPGTAPKHISAPYVLAGLERIKAFPIPASGGLWLEELLSRRIRAECACASAMMRILGYDFSETVARTHVAPGDGGLHGILDPQLFAAEALEYVEIEVASLSVHLVPADPSDGDTRVGVFFAKGAPVEDRRQRKRALDAGIRKYLDSGVYKHAAEPTTPFQQLPTAVWNDAQNVLTVAGWVTLDFGQHQRSATLSRIRAILKATADRQSRDFDLDKVQRSISQAGFKMIPAEKLARWKHDGFKRDPELFDVLFKPAGRGSVGDYRVNVRLTQG